MRFVLRSPASTTSHRLPGIAASPSTDVRPRAGLRSAILEQDGPRPHLLNGVVCVPVVLDTVMEDARGLNTDWAGADRQKWTIPLVRPASWNSARPRRDPPPSRAPRLLGQAAGGSGRPFGNTSA